MGYPTSVPALWSANTGDVVQAAHINDLRTEVTNLADGLLNGLQHALAISTGGLTVSTGNAILGQSLSVAGGSTLASLDVVGASTFHGPVTFSSGVTFAGRILPTIPYCEVTHSTLQNTASATETGLNWDTEVSDPYGMHSTSVNSSRITFTESTGRYEVGCQVTWAAASSGSQTIRVLQNDSSGVAQSAAYFPTAGNLDDQVVGFVRAASTSDYVTVRVVQASGSTKSVSASTVASLKFWARLVSL